MEQNNAFLGSTPIGKLMRGYALPCIISLLVGALYNIVDQIFIANASYLGSYGNAANTVVFPLTVVALAIAVMIGDGCCAFVSISLGRQEGKKASRSVGNAVLLCVAASLILTAVYLIFADQIIAMFGGTVNEETFLHSQEYFFYITIGIPLYMFGQAMNPVIRADGSPRFAMVSTLAGAIANIILDPIFIFCFRWGMMGAAVATVIGQAITAALAVWYLCHMKIVKLSKQDFRLDGAVCGRTLGLGITSFLSQISLVAAMAAINNMLRKYGALDEIFSPNARAGSQTWPKRRRTAHSCMARSASATPAGQRTANRTISTPIPMCPRTAKSRWYTMVSLKIIWRSGNFSRKRAYSLPRKRTARVLGTEWLLYSYASQTQR